jgi:hypothetical protein
MDCNAMCPKINDTKIEKSLITENSTLLEKVKSEVLNLHRITISAIVVYIIFVITFIFSNILLSLWIYTSEKKNRLMKSKKKLQ